MNYIARLQADLAAARAEIVAKDEALHAFRVHLHGDKYCGADPDGSRRDWIAIADVLAWTATIQDAGTCISPDDQKSSTTIDNAHQT